MKLAIVGGGSTYTPELCRGLVERAPLLGLEEIALQDVRPDRLDPVAGFCRRLAASRSAAVRVTDTLDLDRALDGAAFVVVQIRVGGQEERREDERMGLRHGVIGQETTGAGGFAKALRTLPVVLDIARRVEALCPDAWLLNFTNPSGMVAEALLRHGRERSVGLCNVPIEMHMEVARLVGREPAEVRLDWVGLNHLGWLRRVLVGGRDVLPDFIDQIERGVPGPANVPEIGWPAGFLRALGMIPSSYVRYFWATDEMMEELRSRKETRAEEVMRIEAELLRRYADPESPPELPDLLSQRGGAWYSRLAVDLVGALLSDSPSVHIVNTLNRGALTGLPDDASVEVPCEVSRRGVRPLPAAAVEESILGLLRAVKSYERLAIEAALERSRDKALLALVAHPLVPSVRVAKALLEDLVRRGLV